jgi:small subunit ribosomal protein S18
MRIFPSNTGILAKELTFMAMQRRNNRERDREQERDRNAIRKRAKILEPNTVVDINDIDLLRRFVTDYGKIIPARISGVTAAQQRKIKHGVRRARNMGLLA